MLEEERKYATLCKQIPTKAHLSTHNLSHKKYHFKQKLTMSKFMIVLIAALILILLFIPIMRFIQYSQ